MPCAKGMPTRKDDVPGSGCHRACLHRQSVTEYRDWRHAWVENRERGEAMQMEDDDYRAAFPPPTFGDWLRGAGRTIGRDRS